MQCQLSYILRARFTSCPLLGVEKESGREEKEGGTEEEETESGEEGQGGEQSGKGSGCTGKTHRRRSTAGQGRPCSCACLAAGQRSRGHRQRILRDQQSWELRCSQQGRPHKLSLLGCQLQEAGLRDRGRHRSQQRKQSTCWSHCWQQSGHEDKSCRSWSRHQSTCLEGIAGRWTVLASWRRIQQRRACKSPWPRCRRIGQQGTLRKSRIQREKSPQACTGCR